MKVAFFSPKLYDREYFDKFNHFFGHMPDFIETRLNSQTVRLAKDYDAKSAFVLDKADQPDQYTYYRPPGIPTREAPGNIAELLSGILPILKMELLTRML